MDEARLKALVAEATAGCYDEHEAFLSMLATLNDRLQFPIEARMHGEEVIITGLDEYGSNVRRGILAVVELFDESYRFPLTDLAIEGAKPTNAEWLVAYRYWWHNKGK